MLLRIERDDEGTLTVAAPFKTLDKLLPGEGGGIRTDGQPLCHVYNPHGGRSLGVMTVEMFENGDIFLGGRRLPLGCEFDYKLGNGQTMHCVYPAKTATKEDTHEPNCR